MENGLLAVEDVSRVNSPSIAPLLHARISEYATTVMIARHRPSSLPTETCYSPFSSSPSTAVNSRAPSPTKEFIDDDEEASEVGQDRLKWRLASGFFALFVGGWADGGESCFSTTSAT